MRWVWLILGVVSLAAAQPAVPVPFVGCKSGGQLGPKEGPAPKTKSVEISREAAGQLAYYAAGQGPGVLGPRGWYCFATYGSGGDALFVSPQPIDSAKLFSTDWAGFAGPAIEIDYRFGDTSGRFAVAEIIARVFPAYAEFVSNLKNAEPGTSFPSTPYPADRLTYKSKNIVEYTTPAGTDGLGTHFSVKKNDSEICGVAMLVGTEPNLLLAAIRLPAALSGLTPAIVAQVERDAERF